MPLCRQCTNPSHPTATSFQCSIPRGPTASCHLSNSKSAPQIRSNAHGNARTGRSMTLLRPHSGSGPLPVPHECNMGKFACTRSLKKALGSYPSELQSMQRVAVAALIWNLSPGASKQGKSALLCSIPNHDLGYDAPDTFQNPILRMLPHLVAFYTHCLVV